MQQGTWHDLASPGATLTSGVTAGFVAGVLFGGVGGRLAMFVLRLTSDPVYVVVAVAAGAKLVRDSLEILP